MPSLSRRIYAFNQAERDLWVERIAASLPTGSRVLDVGAGGCPYRQLFKHCWYETHDFAQLQPSQLRDFSNYGEIDYVSDITVIPVDDRSFDAVICTEVIEHVPDPVAAIREMARILRPGGRIILTAPLGSGLHQQPYHFYGGFTPFWYRRVLAAEGFTDATIEANGGFFRWYGQESQRFNLLLHPSNFTTPPARVLAGAAWALTYPFFRVAMPLFCFFLDAADRTRDFTVGYHVTAVRS
jgi:SAM-dependent methyltransferase